MLERRWEGSVEHYSIRLTRDKVMVGEEIPKILRRRHQPQLEGWGDSAVSWERGELYHGGEGQGGKVPMLSGGKGELCYN